MNGASLGRRYHGPMDVSSRELREGNIRDALRGYNHDDVDELLERAASTIDGLGQRVGELTERVNQIESEATRGRETEEMLQRTLLLAQRAADEAVEEARADAQRILEEAQEKAGEVITDAERNARREMEEESRRLQREVLELAAKREALDRDVTSLVEFADRMGDRLREAFETQLAALEAHRVDVGARPQLSDVELPPPIEGYRRHEVASERVDAGAVEAGVVDAGPETVELAQVEQLDEEIVVGEPAVEERSSGARVPPAPPPEPAPDIRAVESDEQQAPGRPESERSGHRDLDEAESERRSPLLDERFGLGAARPLESRGKLFDSGEVLEGEVLDDDTFFASLRDAVRDERPLGPREEEDSLGPPEKHGDIFDEENDEEGGRRFFRRRG